MGKKRSTRTLSLRREYKKGAREWEKTALNYRNRLSDWVVLTKCKFQFKIDYNDNWIKTNGKTVESRGVRSMYGVFFCFMLRWFNMAHSVLLISGAGVCTAALYLLAILCWRYCWCVVMRDVIVVNLQRADSFHHKSAHDFHTDLI